MWKGISYLTSVDTFLPFLCTQVIHCRTYWIIKLRKFVDLDHTMVENGGMKPHTHTLAAVNHKSLSMCSHSQTRPFSCHLSFWNQEGDSRSAQGFRSGQQVMSQQLRPSFINLLWLPTLQSKHGQLLVNWYKNILLWMSMLSRHLNIAALPS